MGSSCRSMRVGVHELQVKGVSCFREVSGRSSVIAAQGAANHRRTDSKPSSLPPTLHNLQADLSAQQTGIGRVVAHRARRQVKLVDEGRALIQSVVYPEIGLCIGKPARA